MKTIQSVILLTLLCTGLVSARGIELGDAAFTGFSGVVIPAADERFPQQIKTPRGGFLNRLEDELFIDPDGPSLIVKSLQTQRRHIWDASLLSNPTKLKIEAKKIGQVFGVTMDDSQAPNIYVTATSFYGLHIVTDDLPEKLKLGRKTFVTGDSDRRPERHIRGIRFARWMNGMFGEGGGPGTVWKIDGRTGEVTKFADITLDGIPNSGPALGNIAFDKKHKSFFVSDLDTGMIHRLSYEGKDLSHFDHGVTGRKLHGLRPIPLNPLNRAEIQSHNFDATDPKTWGYAREGRRVYGLTVSGNRLFYAVYNGSDRASEIWSVGLDDNGNFSQKDVRFELLVSSVRNNFPITDLIVRNGTELILAQRPLNTGSYAFDSFMTAGEAQVLKYHLKIPQDGLRDRWYPQAQEYYLGFEAPFRKSVGGIALGYLYRADGSFDSKRCIPSIWITGEHLRRSRRLGSILGADGNGIQGYPYLLNDSNRPALVSLSLYYPPLVKDVRGAMGDVAIAADPCVCRCDGAPVEGPVTGSGGIPPIGAADPLLDGMANEAGAGGGLSGSDSWPYDNEPWPDSEVPQTPIACLLNPSLCQEPPKGAQSCLQVKTTPDAPYFQADGSWDLPLYGIRSANGLKVDTLKVTPVAGASAITNGPILDAKGATLNLTGAAPGSFAVIDICGFNKEESQSGKPYECCNVRIKFKVGTEGKQTLEVLQ